MIPEDAEARDALAAEYVLGTLDARAAREVAQALAGDAALAEAVARWEARLAPLSALAPPEAPPPALWPRIERSLGLAPPTPARAASRVSLWRSWAFGATALAAGLAAFVVLRPTEPPRLVTVLLTDRAQPAWLVEAERDAIRLAAVNPQAPPEGRVLQLWALPQGATAPTSLGLIPAAGEVRVTPQGLRPEPGMLIEISLEPPGGSPTGRPTGPILFIGRLAPARGT
jgi:anti-sigma-K factor RskA